MRAAKIPPIHPGEILFIVDAVSLRPGGAGVINRAKGTPIIEKTMTYTGIVVSHDVPRILDPAMPYLRHHSFISLLSMKIS